LKKDGVVVLGLTGRLDAESARPLAARLQARIDGGSGPGGAVSDLPYLRIDRALPGRPVAAARRHILCRARFIHTTSTDRLAHMYGNELSFT
jgi:hypothetical protein